MQKKRGHDAWLDWNRSAAGTKNPFFSFIIFLNLVFVTFIFFLLLLLLLRKHIMLTIFYYYKKRKKKPVYCCTRIRNNQCIEKVTRQVHFLILLLFSDEITLEYHTHTETHRFKYPNSSRRISLCNKIHIVVVLLDFDPTALEEKMCCWSVGFHLLR